MIEAAIDNIHIFWDNTNIFLGAIDTATQVEPTAPRYAVRVYWRNLYNLVVRERQAITKEIAGSVPPQAADLWAYAEQMGFKTTLLHRVENSFGILREQAVDEILHLRIANTILSRRIPETIILLSGDGRETPTGTSFPGQCRLALNLGWKIEIYSWGVTFNSLKYGQLKDEFPDLVSISFLDEYYNSLTFLKAGTYWDLSSSGVRVEFTIPGRIVQPLMLK